MSIYKNAFLRALLLDDGNVAGSGGALGDWTQSHFSGDFYAPGDARRPFALGAMQRRAGVSKKKKKKKKKKGKKKKSTIKEYRNIEPTGGQHVSDETMELINLVGRASDDDQSQAMAEYKVTETYNGWGENLQDKIKRELKLISNTIYEPQPHKGAMIASVVLKLIKQAEQKAKGDEEEGDVDPNGGWGGLSH